MHSSTVGHFQSSYFNTIHRWPPIDDGTDGCSETLVKTLKIPRVTTQKGEDHIYTAAETWVSLILFDVCSALQYTLDMRCLRRQQNLTASPRFAVCNNMSLWCWIRPN